MTWCSGKLIGKQEQSIGKQDGLVGNKKD